MIYLIAIGHFRTYFHEDDTNMLYVRSFQKLIHSDPPLLRN